MRGSLAGDGRARGLSLGLEGGVAKWVSFECLRLFSEGELGGVRIWIWLGKGKKLTTVT